MTEDQHKQAVANVYATTFEIAAKIGQNAGWAYARALKQVTALDNAYMMARYKEHFDALLAREAQKNPPTEFYRITQPFKRW